MRFVLKDGKEVECDVAQDDYTGLVAMCAENLEKVGEAIPRIHPDEIDIAMAIAEHLGRKAMHCSEKCDELLKENDELRAKLEMPEGWTADNSPTYQDLARAFVMCNERNIELQTELSKYYRHSHETGKKKPTYNEWMGAAIRLKEQCDALTRENEMLKASKE